MLVTKENWQTWVDTYYEILLKRVLALFRGKSEEATDFLHDLLLEMKRKWSSIEHPQAWILKTMRLRMADTFSRRTFAATEQVNVMEQPKTAGDPSLHLDLEKALSKLSKKHQHILKLFLEGNSIDAIANILHISTDNAYQRLSRARRSLKLYYE
ncbi:MAG: sigma-70 family RNA polymerase sigma factor [Myxococcota bacterium]